MLARAVLRRTFLAGYPAAGGGASIRTALGVTLLGALLTGTATPAREQATQTFDLTSASIADINAAFDSGALTSETLTKLFLARIDAYDKRGPRLNSVLFVNAQAVNEARARDAERRDTKSRGPLHGIPVLLKANIDTVGLPSTAAFYGLRTSMPTADAEQTRRLRAAGAVILGLTNMSEFATGPAISTLGGQMRNPHALDRSPQGSSGGNAAALAAGFAVVAIGTDTGGSVRGPAAVTGISGLRPTFGLVGRGGIIPLALSLDTAGPMAAHVADLAVMLTVMVGPDPRDPGVVKRDAVDYTTALNPKALAGARFGLVRDFMNLDPTADAVTARAADTLRAQGAEVSDVVLPRMLVGLLQGAYETIRDTEFRHEIDRYLATLPDPALPKTHADIIRSSELLLKTPQPGLTPNPARLAAYKREAQTGGLNDQPYRAAVNDARKIVRDILSAILERERLNALIGPTSRPARLIAEESAPSWPGWRTLAAMTGWPELSVPVGFTSDTALPIGLSFLGPAFSDAQLLAYGHALQRALPPRRLPQATPRLSGERFDYRVTGRQLRH